MKNLRWQLLLVFTFLLCGDLLSSPILVGPSRQYKSLQQVTGLLQPGDTVLVDGNAAYSGGIQFTTAGASSNRIVVRGVPINGRRPVIDGGINAVSFVDRADSYTIEGFEIRNATFRGIYHQARDLVVRDVIVHHCRNGLMGADNGSGSLLLKFSEFYANGEGTTAHQIYMATDEAANPGSSFRMQFCYIHDGTGGNNVKSRAERNEIYYNWIEGAVYHELELIGPDPAGGVPAALKREDSDVVGNVLWKKSTSSGGQANFYVVRFGGDGTGESRGRYRFVNNTVIMGTSGVFRLFDGIESVEMHNNVFYLPGGGTAALVRTVEAKWSTGSEIIEGANNWVSSTLSAVPGQWLGTLRGSNPAFASFNTNNLVPDDGSALVDAGVWMPQSPPDHLFPSPLFPPGFEPPGARRGSPDSAFGRITYGTIDIGAFERPSAAGVTLVSETPIVTGLEQNYPNPFNPVTTIRFNLAQRAYVRLTIFNTLGQRVAQLADGITGRGYHELQFDGSSLASGVYFCHMQVRLLHDAEGLSHSADPVAGGIVETRKLVLVR